MSFELDRVHKSFEIPIPPADRARTGAWFAPRSRPLAALDGVSLAVPRGQAVGVIGPNGSGKSTLLKILAGVTEPDSGTARVEGRVGALLEVGAGFHPDLTGAENVALNASLIGLGRREIEARIAEIVAFSELERFMDTPVKRYSSGMVVRLGFAVAIQLRPDILLLDETFAVGDARFQTRALEAIRRMKTAGVTLALVSHNTDLVMELADRAIWLDHGRVRMDGSPAEVVAQYRRDCGGRLMSSDRLMAGAGSGGGAPGRAGAAGAAEALPGAEPRPPLPWRIASAVWERGATPHGGAHEAATERIIELESRDAASLVLELSGDAAADNDGNVELEIEALFIRDDRRAVARSVSRLTPGPGAADAARTWRARLTFDPIRLAFGEYRAQLTLCRAGCASGVSGDSAKFAHIEPAAALDAAAILDTREAAGVLRITTPLPYDFRLIAEVDAEWV